MLGRIVGYTYAADNYCESCLVELLFNNPVMPTDKVDSWLSTEDGLNNIAKILGIDRNDENTFDSGHFPKVIIDQMIDTNDRCGLCDELLEDE